MTKFDQITTSTSTLATFLAALPTMKGPWDEAFDKAFCSSCAVQDCNEEGCPYQKIRDAAILWWLTTPADGEVESGKEQATADLWALIERATPQVPTKDSLADRGCPACGAYINWDAMNDPLEYAPRHCKNCGQALDWSQEGKT